MDGGGEDGGAGDGDDEEGAYFHKGLRLYGAATT